MWGMMGLDLQGVACRQLRSTSRAVRRGRVDGGESVESVTGEAVCQSPLTFSSSDGQDLSWIPEDDQTSNPQQHKHEYRQPERKHSFTTITEATI